MITARQHLPTFPKVHFSLSRIYNLIEMGAACGVFIGALTCHPSRDCPAPSTLARWLCGRGNPVCDRGMCFKDVITPGLILLL